MKTRGNRPTAFICFEVFGTRDEVRSPVFLQVFSNDTIKMQMQVFDLRLKTCFIADENQLVMFYRVFH